MFFSVIVPVYNVEKYLSKCIESILNQSYNDFELILVDDGSPDNSPKICDRYASQDSRVKVIHKNNEGVAIARKNGVDVAKGDFITFIDADDLITSDCLEKLSEIIQSFSVDVIKFGFLIEKNDGSTYVSMPKFKGYFSKEGLEKNIYPLLIQNEQAQYLGTSVCAGVFRANILKPYMIANPQAKIGEDSACIIPTIAHSKSVYFLNEALYFYRYNFSSATKSHKVFDWNNPEIVAKHISEHIDSDLFDFKQQISRRVVHDVFNVAVTQFYQKKSYHCISENIKKELCRPFYSSCIKEASFRRNFKAQLMHFCLKKKLMLPIFFFSKIKLLLRH